jgi:exopolysaccharide biosynthesis polyprenyl glycosylphosphotransferase
LNCLAVVAVCYVALLASFHGVTGVLATDDDRLPLFLFPIVVALVLWGRGVYPPSVRTTITGSLSALVGAVSTGVMVVTAISLAAAGAVSYPGRFVTLWLYTLGGASALQFGLTLATRQMRSSRRGLEPAIIVGAGLVGAAVATQLAQKPEYGFEPIGFVDDQPRPIAAHESRVVPVLGGVEDLREIVRDTGARRVIIAFSRASDEALLRVLSVCKELGVGVSVVPRMFESLNSRLRYEPLGPFPLLALDTVDPRGLGFAVKYVVDRLLAAVLLGLATPLMILISLGVWSTSGRPVVIRQRRVGRDGRAFDMLKFRTMRADGDDRGVGAFEPSVGLAPGGVEGVDRRTSVGKLLRRTSMDELPQLLNVLKGEMSLVGPRPERPEFVSIFENQVGRYGERHRVKAGITGLAQVHGLRGRTSLAERVGLDNYYISHWSLGLDLKIMLLTVLRLLKGAE